MPQDKPGRGPGGPGGFGSRGVVPPQRSEMDGEGTNFKSLLAELVSRVTQRQAGPQDIIYNERPCHDGSFLFSVRVMALDQTLEFEGQRRSKRRDAEQAAAQAAFSHFQAQLAQHLPPMPGLGSSGRGMGGPRGLGGRGMGAAGSRTRDGNALGSSGRGGSPGGQMQQQSFMQSQPQMSQQGMGG